MKRLILISFALMVTLVSHAMMIAPADFRVVCIVHKFWLESLCNLPIDKSPLMWYNVDTTKERGNQNVKEKKQRTRQKNV